MSTTTQQQRPLRGHNRSHVQNPPEHKLHLPAPAVSLPKDMYLHTPTYNALTEPNGCSTEWWWHIGTLKTASGRTFGFEINAAGFYPGGFTEVMLTDVKNKIHYHETKGGLSIPKDWAESDPSKPWKVNLENVSMNAPQADPTKNMKVTASLNDTATKATVAFDLTMSQEGKPFIVWGNGEHPNPPKPIKYDNNFYFSLTRINTSGTITITAASGEVETHTVSGVTWMDHEWGKFGNHGKGIKWILQDMQLDNGVTISNYSLTTPKLNEACGGVATVQISAEGRSYYIPTTLTPTKVVTIGNKKYFTEVSVEIPDLKGSFVVKTLFADQVFEGGVYEGAGTVTGTMTLNDGPKSVSGTAWLEQTN